MSAWDLLASDHDERALTKRFSPRVLDARVSVRRAKLGTTGQSICGDPVADRDDAPALVLTPIWQAEEAWQPGIMYGACWIHRNAGLLPAL